jgi:hypothetical protein
MLEFSLPELPIIRLEDAHIRSFGGIVMIDQISSTGLPVSSNANPVSAPALAAAKAPSASASKTAAPKTETTDSVEISMSAQIKSLKKQGENIEEIATQLGLEVKRVAIYLGEKA